MRSSRIAARLLLALVTIAVTGLASSATADARTIYTEVAHKTSYDPLGGKPIAVSHDCATVKVKTSKGLVGVGAACFRAKHDAWYIQDLRADGAVVEVHAIGDWGNPSTGYLCADRAGVHHYWTTCDDWDSITPDHREFAWSVSAWKGKKQIAVSDTIESDT